MTLLTLENVSFNLKGTPDPILKQIHYTIHPQDFVILLGSNGSGKSTLLKLLYRYHHADLGNIQFLNQPIESYSSKLFNQQVAFLTQNCTDSLFNTLTLYENYLLVKLSAETSLSLSLPPLLSKLLPKSLSQNINPAAEKAFLSTYLNDFNPNLINKLYLPVQQLSGGEKQALILAFSLLKPPTLLLLDEHTSALDPKTSDQIMQLTQQKVLKHQITCVLTTHDLDIALKYGNRILMLQNGRILKTFDAKEKSNLTKEELMGCYYI